jgi:DNA-binding response OmpR family regulator
MKGAVGALAAATWHGIVSSGTMNIDSSSHKSILHVCQREMLRPLRDQILRISGYDVESTLSFPDGLAMFKTRPYDLVLIDVAGEAGVRDAETLCSEIKTTHHHQLVAFMCNWRVANLTDCPDEILRTEFNPAAFVAGVRAMLPN